MRTLTKSAPLLTALIVAVAGTASAQDAVDGEFSVQRFEPAMGPRNFMSVAGARVDGEFSWSAGLMFDYQRKPFLITSCVSSTDCEDPNALNPQDTAVVRDMLTWNLMGTFVPIDILQLGLRVPVAFASGDGVDLNSGGPSTAGLSGAGMGDLTLEGKFRIIGEPDDMFVFGGAGELSAPLGHATSEGNYIGNATPLTGGVRAIFDFKPIPELAVGANLRGVFKENATFGNTTLGPELRWGVAVGYQPHDLVRIIAEGFGSTRFSGVNGTNTIEIDGGVQIMPVDGMLTITAAGGAGVLKGVGAPLGRAIVGVTFTWEGSHDQDEDGVPDEQDQCPADREDQDGVEDGDGCPEDDADHDKIPDDVDKCPLEPESENNYEDDDGCPDVAKDTDKDGIFDDRDRCPKAAGKMQRAEFFGCPDTDEDGVADKVDKCKADKEDTDGFEDLDGCPDPDNDQDGVLDIDDECGDEKENKNGVDDGDGCPDFDPDADGDGIPDTTDKCVDEAEILNGVDDDDGCPDASPALAEVDPLRIAVLEPISFEGDKITDEQSFKVLIALANGLKNWKGIRKIEVIVIVPESEAALGQSRAESVIAALGAAGVDKKRLVPKHVVGEASKVTFKVTESPRWKRP